MTVPSELIFQALTINDFCDPDSGVRLFLRTGAGELRIFGSIAPGARERGAGFAVLTLTQAFFGTFPLSPTTR